MELGVDPVRTNGAALQPAGDDGSTVEEWGKYGGSGSAGMFSSLSPPLPASFGDLSAEG